MIPRFASMSITGLVISGCAGLASTGTMSSSSSRDAVLSEIVTLHRTDSGFQVIDPSALQIPLKDMQAGQQVRIVTSASTRAEMKDDGRVETTEYVGTVDAINADNIVLKDASLVTSARVVRGTPIVSRIPYFSRMFKNTSVGRDVQPLPHGVTVPLSNVIVALGAGSEIEERIGVDFDHNADGNESVKRTEASFPIREQSNEPQTK